MMKGQNKWFDPKFCLKKIEQLLLNLYSIFKADVLESSNYLKSIGIGGTLGGLLTSTYKLMKSWIREEMEKM